MNDNIGDYTTSQLFFRLAIAYADSSLHIARSMLNGGLPKTFAHAQTVHFLLDHAVELFLKGAIVKKSTNEIRNNHDLQPFYNRYRNLYPKQEFEFTCRIHDIVAENEENPHSVFPRYPVDQQRNLWKGYNAYTLEEWAEDAEKLREDFDRLIPMIDPLPLPAIGMAD